MSLSLDRLHQLRSWIALGGTVLSLAAGGAAGARAAIHATLATKVDTAAYNRDRALQAVRDSDEHELLLDVLCSPHVDPHNRRCPPR